MNKRLFLLGWLGCCLTGVNAQTDVTSQYIKNPSFEVGFDGWESSELQAQTNSSFTLKEGNTYVEKWVSTNSRVGKSSLQQTLQGLPAGHYRLTVSAQNINEAKPTQKCTSAYIYGEDQKTYVNFSADYSVEFSTLSGIVEVGFKSTTAANGNWLAIDNFRLYLLETIDNQVLVDSLATLIQQADALTQEEMDQKVLTHLKEAADLARSLSAASAVGQLQEALNALLTWLDKADLAYRLAHPTGTTGVAPIVSVTNHHVATGATEALMRAEMSGSPLLEKGICWSTEHHPTVLDNRSTKTFSLNGTIYHIQGLQPATVYYLRPYILKTTYEVAYGEEVKIVTHPQGGCTGTWNNGAPTEEANKRCKTAIDQTIAYFNEWTGIQGFTLTGNYGADTPTADCSYGGWMRIGPKANYQAIGTVIHETGHGVGVGTSDRWWDENFHSWEWKGREANEMYQFLENQENNAAYYMVGDNTHGWGQSATYDWFVNGADKDKHSELQYIGGCVLLHSLFVDGLCPTSGYHNGLPSYTYNYDDTATYYIMCKSADRYLGTGLLYAKKGAGSTNLYLTECLKEDATVPAEAGWKLEFDPQTGMYSFRSAVTGGYISHISTSAVRLKDGLSAPTATEQFQLMPDRTDVTLNAQDAKIQTHGYWFTWYDNGNRALTAHSTVPTAACTVTSYSSSDNATRQQWIILTAEQVAQLNPTFSALEVISDQSASDQVVVAPVYNLQGQRVKADAEGFVIKNGKVNINK